MIQFKLWIKEKQTSGSCIQVTSSWKWPILIAEELLSRLELYVNRKISFVFLAVHVLKPKAAELLYRSSLLANKKKVLILLVPVLTLWACPGCVTVSTKYETADLNYGYSGSLVITVAVERRRRPAVIFSVPTPHKPTTDWAIDHGLQKQRQILQVPTVVAKNSWCIKATLKKSLWFISLVWSRAEKRIDPANHGTQRSCARIVMLKLYETLYRRSRENRLMKRQC